MSMTLLTSRRLMVSLLVAIVLTVVLALGSGVGRIQGQERPQLTTDTALLTTNRTTLKLCVESLVPDADSRQFVGSIKGAFTKISNHPDFQAAGLAHGPVVVDADCPEEPTIFDPAYDKRSGKIGQPLLVEVPSEYRTFVFIASRDQIEAAFVDPDRYPRTTIQEVMRLGDMYPVATVALYLTPEELTDRDLLERSLTRSVGLRTQGESESESALPVDPRGK